MISQKPSIAGSGVLDQEPATLPEILACTVQRATGKGITYLQQDGSEQFQTYSDLCVEAEHILAGLRGLGLQTGAKVILQIEDNQQYLSALWACVLGGFVAVPMTVATSYEQPGVITSRLYKAWQLCGQPLILASTLVAPALAGLSSALGMEEARIETVEAVRSRTSTEEARAWYGCQPDDPFLILFTSGSTGTPKGVTLTHHNVLSMIRGYLHLEGLTSNEVSFNWMPLDHVGGLVAFHMRDVYLGCQQVHTSPQTVLQDPLCWLDWLDAYRATCTWAPNFAYRLITEHLSAGTMKSWDLSALHHILNAGEAIVSKTVRRFLEMLGQYGLPSTALCPSWGMSETSGGVTFSRRFSLETTSDEDRFVDVGELIPGALVQVVDTQGTVLEEGQSGRIQVKGSSVMAGYYRNPELNAEVFSADGWFETGDLGFQREGRLTITGRSKDIIIINGLNYYCHEIEAVVEEVPQVAVTYTGACAVRDATDTTDSLAIFYCTHLADERAIVEQWQEIRRRVISAVGINPGCLFPLERAAMPRTETGKIQRSKLRQQFEAGAFEAERAHMILLLEGAGKAREDAQNEAEEQRGIEQKLLVIWRRVLGMEEIDLHDNFFDLGGDSLSNTRAVALARSAMLPITQNHISQYQTIAELASALRKEAER